MSRAVASVLITAAIVLGIWLGTVVFAFVTGAGTPPPAL
jgi:hypothetical protein